MPDVAAREKDAHRASVALTIADVAGFLQETLGQKLTAYIADTEDAKAVGAWARADRTPRPPAQDRLREAYRVFHLLQEQESPYTVRAWFVGLNPQLHDESPATILRAGNFKEALVAARAFLSGG